MTCDATTSLADMTTDELAALPMEELRARMEDAAVRVMATDRAILSMSVSEIAARYRCSADVARRALMAARSAQAAQAADDWTSAGAREIPEWRRTY